MTGRWAGLAASCGALVLMILAAPLDAVLARADSERALGAATGDRYAWYDDKGLRVAEVGRGELIDPIERAEPWRDVEEGGRDGNRYPTLGIRWSASGQRLAYYEDGLQSQRLTMVDVATEDVTRVGAGEGLSSPAQDFIFHGEQLWILRGDELRRVDDDGATALVATVPEHSAFAGAHDDGPILRTPAVDNYEFQSFDVTTERLRVLGETERVTGRFGPHPSGGPFAYVHIGDGTQNSEGVRWFDPDAGQRVAGRTADVPGTGIRLVKHITMTSDESVYATLIDVDRVDDPDLAVDQPARAFEVTEEASRLVAADVVEIDVSPGGAKLTREGRIREGWELSWPPPRPLTLTLPDGQVEQVSDSAQAMSFAPPTATECPDVHLLGLRGSGQARGDFGGLGDQIGPFADELRAQARREGLSLEVSSVDYDAVGVAVGIGSDYLGTSEFGYSDSVERGRERIEDRLTNDDRHDCLAGETDFVLAGFSQGAEVIRHLLDDAPEARERVAAVMLYGDPLFHHGLTGALGIPGDDHTSGRMVGIHRTLGDGPDAYPDEFTGRVASYCARRVLSVGVVLPTTRYSDIVCDALGRAPGTGPHSDYDPDAHEDAAARTIGHVLDGGSGGGGGGGGRAATFEALAELGDADGDGDLETPVLEVSDAGHNRSRLELDADGATRFLVALRAPSGAVETVREVEADDHRATLEVGDQRVQAGIAVVAIDDDPNAERDAQTSEVATIDTPTAGPGGELRVDRHGGTDRFATSAAVSESTFDTARTVVVATGVDFADALAGGPLARQLDAPLLLTRRGALPEVVADEIERLGASRALVLGGEAAVAAGVADELGGLVDDVERVAGTDRFDTAARIAQRLSPTNEETVAYLVDGESGWPDAVAVSQRAADEGAAILPVTADGVPEATAIALGGADKVVAVGGTAVVPETVLDEAGQYAAAATDRLAGDDRYATSVAVADADPSSAGSVMLSTGADFADALAAGPAASRTDAALLLAPAADLEEAPVVRDALDARIDAISRAVVVGGEAALSADVAEALRDWPGR